MAVVSGTIGLISAAVGVAGTVASIDQGKKANYNSRLAADEQRKAQSEQRAQNAAQAANERRQQIREERVRRARILQSAENTGTAGSSGAIGAVGGLATNLSSNIGMNLGQIAAGNRMSNNLQNAANFSAAAQNNMQKASNFNQLAGMAGSIFQSAGGMSSVKSLFQGGGSIFDPVGDRYQRSGMGSGD